MKKTILSLLVGSCVALTAIAQTNRITVHMIGDSTMANKPLIPAYSERGWGQMFSMYFLETARVVNYAQGGRSTKSFIAEGRWDTVQKAIQPGDYVVIQFGHNDQKTNDVNRGTMPFGDYATNLVRFVHEARERKAIPILCTPVARRKFDTAGKLLDTHGDYAKAVRRVAKMERTPLLELGHATENLLQKLGPENSKRLFDWVPAGEYAPDSAALEDDTHFNAYGASRVCDLAVVEIAAKVPALAAHLNQSPKSKQPTASQPEK